MEVKAVVFSAVICTTLINCIPLQAGASNVIKINKARQFNKIVDEKDVETVSNNY
jgi:hypothetical protein